MGVKEYIVASSLQVERAVIHNEIIGCGVFYTREDAEKAALKRTKDSIDLGYFARFLVFEATHQTERFAEGEAKLVEVSTY